MLALSPGELGMVLFIFAVVWCSGFLPRFGERMGARLAKERARGEPRDQG